MHDLDRSVPPAHRSAFDSSLSGDEDKDLETEEISAVSKHEDDEPKSRAERVLRNFYFKFFKNNLKLMIFNFSENLILL